MSKQYRPLEALNGFHLTTCCQKLKVSVFRFQGLAIRLPDTRNLTPFDS